MPSTGSPSPALYGASSRTSGAAPTARSRHVLGLPRGPSTPSRGRGVRPLRRGPPLAIRLEGVAASGARPPITSPGPPTSRRRSPQPRADDPSGEPHQVRSRPPGSRRPPLHAAPGGAVVPPPAPTTGGSPPRPRHTSAVERVPTLPPHDERPVTTMCHLPPAGSENRRVSRRSDAWPPLTRPALPQRSPPATRGVRAGVAPDGTCVAPSPPACAGGTLGARVDGDPPRRRAYEQIHLPREQPPRLTPRRRPNRVTRLAPSRPGDGAPAGVAEDGRPSPWSDVERSLMRRPGRPRRLRLPRREGDGERRPRARDRAAATARVNGRYCVRDRVSCVSAGPSIRRNG